MCLKQRTEICSPLLCWHSIQSIDAGGKGALFYAGAGIKKPWAMSRNLKSKHYTTEWDDLLEVG